MARMARVVVPGFPHHVTQRGNRRLPTFFHKDDFRAYQELMAVWCGRYGVAVNVVEFTYAPGDTDGDGDADLSDFAAFQNCFGHSPVADVCLPLDFNTDGNIDLLDFAAFQAVFRVP